MVQVTTIINENIIKFIITCCKNQFSIQKLQVKNKRRWSFQISDQTEFLQHKVFEKFPTCKNSSFVACFPKLLRNFGLEFEKISQFIRNLKLDYNNSNSWGSSGREKWNSEPNVSLTKVMVSHDLPRSTITNQIAFNQWDLHSTLEFERAMDHRYQALVSQLETWDTITFT